MKTPLDTLTDHLATLQKRRRRAARQVAALDTSIAQHQAVINELLAIARRQRAAKTATTQPTKTQPTTKKDTKKP